MLKRPLKKTGSLPARFDKKVVLILILCCFVLTTACSPLDKLVSLFVDDGSGYIFKMSVEADPKNLDPQLAADKSSVQVSKNLFVGLLKFDNDGGIIPAVAKDYTISSDGLVYTFYLDDRYEWKAVGGFNAKVTSNDFVFGFERLFSPETRSPYADKYFCIKNSKRFNSGEAVNIGVTALDEYILEITLEYPNAMFLSLLTRLPASPCNKEFFDSCKGKYGLEADCIASNGPFYVRYWLHDPYGKDNYIRLRRNECYTQISRVYPAGVNFLVEGNKDVRFNDFTAGTTSVYVSDSLPTASEESDRKKIYNTSIGLVISEKSNILSQPDIREILAMCIDHETLSNKVPDHFLPANGFIPPISFVGGTLFRSSVKEPSGKFNKKLAEYRWSFLLTDNEKLSLAGATVMVPSSFAEYDYIRDVTAQWSSSLYLNIGLEVVSDEDYKRRTESGDYDIRLAIIRSDSGSAFDNIESVYKSLNRSREEANLPLENRDKYKTLTGAIRDIDLFERSLLDYNEYIPLWYSPVFLYMGDDCSDFSYDPFSGAVLFEKAKHF